MALDWLASQDTVSLPCVCDFYMHKNKIIVMGLAVSVVIIETVDACMIGWMVVVSWHGAPQINFPFLF